MSCKSAKVATGTTSEKSGASTNSPITKNNTTLLLTNQEMVNHQTLVIMDSTGHVRVLAPQASEQGIVKPVEPDSNIKISGRIDAVQYLKAQTEMAKMNSCSASMLLTKEALYRLSEAYFNGLIDSVRYGQLYKAALSQSAELMNAEIELEEAKAETIFAETEKAKIELQKMQLELEKLKIEKGLYVIPKEEPKVEEKAETEEK